MRNLRNMESVGYNGISKAISQIRDPKLLPINFIKAYEITPKYEYELEQKYLELFSTKEKMVGKTLLLVDVSGSMQGDREKNAGGLAMIAREKFDDLEVRIFGNITNRYITYEGFDESMNIIEEMLGFKGVDRDVVFLKCASNKECLALRENILKELFSLYGDLILNNYKIERIIDKVNGSITRRLSKTLQGFRLMKSCKNKGESTFLGKSIGEINNLDIDRLIVITDEQSNDSVPKPNCKKSYMINVSSNKNGVGYNGNWVHIDGFSDKIIDYIEEYEKSID